MSDYCKLLIIYINTVLCPINIKVNSYKIELIMHTSCYCILDLPCVRMHCREWIETVMKWSSKYILRNVKNGSVYRNDPY